jgi:hypothetical protein
MSSSRVGPSTELPGLSPIPSGTPEQGSAAASDSEQGTRTRRHLHPVSAGIRKVLNLRRSPRPLGDYEHPKFSKRKYLTCDELRSVLPSGKEADKRSGIVPAHIEVLKNLAAELDMVLSFRKVNPDSHFWISYGDAPMKGLDIKTKTEKGGVLGGLILSPGGRRLSTISSLGADLFGRWINKLIGEDKLELVSEESGEDPSIHKSVTVRDLSNDKIYKFVLNETEKRFKAYKQDGEQFKVVKFKGVGGLPLTSDDDGFDWYPRLKQKNFAGFKDIPDPKAKERWIVVLEKVLAQVRSKIPEDMPEARRKLRALIWTIMQDVLELQEVRELKEGRGRLTAIDNFVVDTGNRKIKETGYHHDALMHGKEKRNSQFPEQCEEVYFIYPDRSTTMSTNWDETQAVDYAIQQDGFVSTMNRVHNIQAGSQPLFHDQRAPGPDGEPIYKHASGKTIAWNSREAAERVYNKYAHSKSLRQRLKNLARFSGSEGFLERRRRESRAGSSTEGDASSVASLAGSVSRLSIQRSYTERSTRSTGSGHTEESGLRLSAASTGSAGASEPRPGRLRRTFSVASRLSTGTVSSVRTDSSVQSVPPWLLEFAHAARSEPDPLHLDETIAEGSGEAEGTWAEGWQFPARPATAESARRLSVHWGTVTSEAEAERTIPEDDERE